MNQPKRPPAIIHENAEQDVFVIDIPRSIEAAQQLESSSSSTWWQQDRSEPRLLSCAAMDAPYPGPSTEPKSESARQRLLKQIPVSEREFQASIVPVISGALESVRKHNPRMSWCFPRRVSSTDEYTDFENGEEVGPPEEPGAVSRKRKRERPSSWDDDWTAEQKESSNILSASSEPPVILAPGVNSFESISPIQGSIVQNPSACSVVLRIKTPLVSAVTIPPKSSFLLAHLPSRSSPLPRFSSLSSTYPKFNKFNLIIFDPPWPNRSVRRSAHYSSSTSYDDLRPLIKELITMHLDYPGRPTRTPSSPNPGIVGIWTTNTPKSRGTVHHIFGSHGLEAFEEWIWVKCTSAGEPVLPLNGLWRKPYEVILWGRGTTSNPEGGPTAQVKRRVIFGVPDIHSRKPSLKELVERIFFTDRPTSSCSRGDTEMERTNQEYRRETVREYAALEVFARNLTAGWWACGDEVLRFNHERWWTDRPNE